MPQPSVVARFWRNHSQYNEPFQRVSDAYAFLREGQRRHDMAVWGIARADGSVILDREGLEELKALPSTSLEQRLRDLDRLTTSD